MEFSKTTDIEDVSYVGSPYLPAVLMGLSAPALTDNAELAVRDHRGGGAIFMPPCLFCMENH
jgi:hypothetical protein